MKKMKTKISVTINTKIYEELVETKISKSKLINWLLQQHYNETLKGRRTL